MLPPDVSVTLVGPFTAPDIPMPEPLSATVVPFTVPATLSAPVSTIVTFDPPSTVFAAITVSAGTSSSVKPVLAVKLPKPVTAFAPVRSTLVPALPVSSAVVMMPSPVMLPPDVNVTLAGPFTAPDMSMSEPLSPIVVPVTVPATCSAPVSEIVTFDPPLTISAAITVSAGTSSSVKPVLAVKLPKPVTAFAPVRSTLTFRRC